jgi:predicted nucleotidyltransferase
MKRNKIKKIIRDFFQNKEDIVFVYLFGSFVDEEKFNDIDLALYSKRKTDTIKLAFELEKLTGIRFDIIDIKTAPDHLVHSISKGEVIIDNDEDFRIDFITTAWSRYLDFKYYRDRFLKELNYE